jgi:hypothetical protein
MVMVGDVHGPPQSGRRPDVTRVFNDGIGNANFRVIGPTWTTFPEHFKVRVTIHCQIPFLPLVGPIQYSPPNVSKSIHLTVTRTSLFIAVMIESRLLHDRRRQDLPPKQSTGFRPTDELVQHNRLSLLLSPPNQMRRPNRRVVPHRQRLCSV